MPGYTIANLNLIDNELRQNYQLAKDSIQLKTCTNLDLIFEIAINNKNFFPAIKLTNSPNPQEYINRWVKSYCDAVNHPPSLRTANPKSACTDPAIRVIVQATQGITNEEASTGENMHNLFMSAENIQGNLLEEYIASKVRFYGFLWCAGNVLKAIDFCNTTGSCLLQIKNKSNTENSSSSNIREGTNIKKWFRLSTSTRNGTKRPVYKWELLNTLINNHKTQGYSLPPCNMTEEDYQFFLESVAITNKNLITSR